MRELHLIVFAFTTNCYYWSLYSSSPQKESLFRGMRKELEDVLHEMIKAYQGKNDATVSFLGDQFMIVKLKKDYFKTVIAAVEAAEIESPFTVYKEKLLLILYRYFEDISRGG